MAKGNNTKSKNCPCCMEIVHEEGYEETTIDEIILQSGTSKGSFYHYYSGRMSFWHLSQRSLNAKYEEVMQALDPEDGQL